MFKIEIVKDRLQIENDLNRTHSEDCFVDCLTEPESSYKNICPKDDILVTDYQTLSFDNKRYIIHNSKNQALVDSEVYNFLTTFKSKNIQKNEELTNMLYNLGFLING